MNIETAKEIDMVAYLDGIGIYPVKTRGNDYWYICPFNGERTASFKINRKLNRWYHFGLGKGGNIVDFGILYHGTSVGEFLAGLSRIGLVPVVRSPYQSGREDRENKITITGSKTLSHKGLIAYMKSRCIPANISTLYCKEINFKIGNKAYYATGFPNNGGGFEIRNSFMKVASSPKGITTLKNGCDRLTVLEGFIDFLSYLVLSEEMGWEQTDHLILNSTAFLKKAMPVIGDYENGFLFLDNDPTGQKCSRQIQMLHQGFIDQSMLYSGYDDLNEWLCRKHR